MLHAEKRVSPAITIGPVFPTFKATPNLMPSLFRFLMVMSTLTAIGYGSLYVLAVYFEPEQSEVQRAVPDVKIRR